MTSEIKVALAQPFEWRPKWIKIRPITFVPASLSDYGNDVARCAPANSFTVPKLIGKIGLSLSVIGPRGGMTDGKCWLTKEQALELANALATMAQELG